MHKSKWLYAQQILCGDPNRIVSRLWDVQKIVITPRSGREYPCGCTQPSQHARASVLGCRQGFLEMNLCVWILGYFSCILCSRHCFTVRATAVVQFYAARLLTKRNVIESFGTSTKHIYYLGGLGTTFAFTYMFGYLSLPIKCHKSQGTAKELIFYIQLRLGL